MARLLIFGYIFLIFPGTSILGDNGEDLFEIPRLKNPILFDGKLDEPAWDELDPLPVFMYSPNYASSPSEKSEFYVTYDHEYLYLGGRLFYTEGATVIATSKKRDALDPGNDYLGILLDTFNDNENALGFQTSPTGLRSDFSIDNDAQAMFEFMPFNNSWNTFWDVKTTLEDSLWQVELRVPFSSLRFQDKDGQVIMGMTVWRYIASKQEIIISPLVSNKLGRFSPWKPSQAQKIVLHDVYRKNPLYITPYVLGGLEQYSEKNETALSYLTENDYKLNAGLDIKYGLTSNLTLDLTVNTDFAQVEADDQQVNLTRFSLFFPEKRQFFLERSSIFDFKTGFYDQLFYSRRIGLHEGEIVPIYGGVRLIGRQGKWDLGLMDMQTAANEYIDEDTDSLAMVESTNFGILRVRRQIFNPKTYIGSILTSKIDINGNYNLNIGMDGIFNLFSNDYLTLNYSHTFEGIELNNNQVLDHGKIYFDWARRTDVGFGYNFNFIRAGQFYNPEMGFEMFEDYTSGWAELRYGWVNNKPDKKILKHQFFVMSLLQKRNRDFNTDISFIAPGWFFSTKKGFSGFLTLMKNYENPLDTFELSDEVYFSPDVYRYTTWNGQFSTPANKLLALQAAWAIGTYYDGRILTLGPNRLTLRPSSSVNFSLDYQYNLIYISERQQRFVSHLARLRTEFTFSTKLSLMIFFQYTSHEKFGINNIRFRYNPREGNDLYLVYNEFYNTHLKREIPHLPFTDTRSILLKYTYTFLLNK